MRGVRMRLGTTMPTFKDRFVLEVAGHIDRDQWCMVPNGLISISPGQEFQGPYAEAQDFSLADMGTKVIGFPHNGSEPFGPLVHISFNYEVLYQFIKSLSRDERCKIDLVSGMAALIRATNASSSFNIGVGGVPIISYFDEKGIIHLREDESRLAVELVKAGDAGLLPQTKTRESLESLLKQTAKAEELEKVFLDNPNYPKIMRLLRGYRLD